MRSLALLTLLTVVTADKYIGRLKTLQHDVSGDLYARDENTLIIENFKYDGAGPDAFFWIGKVGSPSNTDEKTTAILAHPYQMQNYGYTDKDAPVLREYNGETVILTLPKNFKVSDISWFSVWCRKFTVDFGSLMFPEDFQVDDAHDHTDLPHPFAPTSTPRTEDNVIPHEPVAEPEAEPGYDHDSKHPSAEPKSKPRSSGAAAYTLTFAGLALSLLLAAL